jgi:hypothetical protein
VATEAARLKGQGRKTKERALFTLDLDRPSHGRTWDTSGIMIVIPSIHAFTDRGIVSLFSAKGT